ncbi:50S ribosomal protein L6 [Desulforhabdus amnigena]|jgi:large subunit ribosomal protein L6|uniref:Large ribosomal subunit protein uL6 n=1 Tax=Desulforhabdus amnigena TaxID=40218 RepID=A0A9W6FWE0_9BACT|nr:50S ribosomal protein L6 [Desulforhabdus amnigena]NLJ27914.1 50S ribosomal protein L6 [Deltaproteobacteria bacterium]GLI36067.1 50S ribosomal protein L6 [Desulforhabdus amnigena]
MSRVGKLPINIPKGVSATLEGLVLTVKGPKGTLARQLPETLDVKIDTATIQIQRRDDTIQSRSLHGLARALVNNMVLGVSEGFKRSLEIQGTGYRAEAQKGVLNLSLGFSHPVQFPLPDGIQAAVERQNIIHLEGIDRELLGQTAARIKALRPVEPYKGKGVRNVGEHIHRKAGKTGSKK